MSKKANQADLTLLKKLVAEAEASLEHAYEARDPNSADPNKHHEFTIRASKAAGVLAGIMQEATMLITDVQAMIRSNETSTLSKAGGLPGGLAELFSGIPGKGGNSN